MKKKRNSRNIISLFFIFLFFIIILMCGCQERKKETPKIGGYWKGSITISGEQILFRMRFVISDELMAFIDIPKQGARGIRLEKVKYTYPAISFELPSEPNRIYFKGVYNQGSISGTLMQGSVEGSFMLSRIEESPENRPVFTREEISHESGKGMIHGELVIPDIAGTFPVVLIISDGGAVDMDGNSVFMPGGNNCLKILAETLAGYRIASLRYDKRGIGKSMEAFSDAAAIRFDHHIEDAAGWIEQLKNDERFFSVGVIGHGDGSLIGMMAVQKAKGDFFISMAGSGKTADMIMLEQLRYSLHPKVFEECERIIKDLKAGRIVDKVSDELKKYFPQNMQPYLISLFRYDPYIEIAALSIPVLIIHGSTDLQINIEDARLLKKAKQDSEFVTIAGMNHILKPASPEPEENLKTYKNPSIPVSQELIAELNRFIFEFVLKL